MSTPLGPALIWCPFPDQAAAEAAIATLLDEGLIACASVLPAMRSHFVWQGKRQVADEAGVVCKTDAALLDRAITRLAVLHPYDEPAIVGWRCDAAFPATVSWLAALVS